MKYTARFILVFVTLIGLQVSFAAPGKLPSTIDICGVSTGLPLQKGLSILEESLSLKQIRSYLSYHRPNPRAWHKYGGTLDGSLIYLEESNRPLSLDILTGKQSVIQVLHAHHSNGLWIHVGKSKIELGESFSSVQRKLTVFSTATNSSTISVRDLKGQSLELNFVSDQLVSAYLFRERKEG